MGRLICGADYFSLVEAKSGVAADWDELRVRAFLQAAQPGDILLVRTPGRSYEAGRRITRNPYDHIAVVLEEGRTLNVVMPSALILPILAFAKPNRKPVLLRPQWRTGEQRDLFVAEMKKFDRGKYNLRKTILGVMVSSLYAWLGIRIPLKKSGPGDSRWICTEAILVSLCKAWPDFEAIEKIQLDYHRLGFATTNDFFRISQERTDLLKIIPYQG